MSLDSRMDKKIMKQFIYHHRIQFPNSSFNTDKTQSFYKRLLSDSDLKNHIENSWIVDGDELVAAHFGFKFNAHLYYYVPVYNNKYKQYGPGQYLLMQMINYYQKQGYNCFDFLRGDEKYKDDWANSISIYARIFGLPVNSPYYQRIFFYMENLREKYSANNPTNIK